MFTYRIPVNERFRAVAKTAFFIAKNNNLSGNLVVTCWTLRGKKIIILNRYETLFHIVKQGEVNVRE